MPTALATIRGRLQIALDDATAAFWTTAELDEHLQRALRDLSHHIPLEKKNTLATVASNRELSIATLVPRIAIVAVEYKTGTWPKTFQPFTVWADTLTFTGDTVPDGANADVYWHGQHTINGTKTLPEDQDETLLFGAAAFACDQQAADATNQLTAGGPATPRDWRSLAAHFRGRYEARLRPRRGIRTHGMFAPADPLPTQDTDPGP